MDTLSESSLTYANHEPCVGKLEDNCYFKTVHYEGNATGKTDFTVCSRADSDEKHCSNKLSTASTTEITSMREAVPMDFVLRNTKVNISENQYFSQCDEKSLIESSSQKERMIVNSDFSGVSKIHPNENSYSYRLRNVLINRLSNSKEPILFCALLGNSELHNSDQQFACGYCDKSFAEVRQLDEHITSHSDFSENYITDGDKKRYSCGLCLKSYTNVDDLKKHIRVHVETRAEEVDGYSCGLCYTSFATLDHLKEHISVHTSNSIFSCGLCKKHFSKIDDLRKHVNVHVFPGSLNVQSKTKLYSCGLCGESFYEIAELLSHRRFHAKRSVRKLKRQKVKCNMDLKLYYWCELCKVSFITALALEKHAEAHILSKDLIVYAGRNLYYCGLCDYSFSKVSELDKHMDIHVSSLNQSDVNFKTRKCRNVKIPMCKTQYFCHICLHSFTNVFDLKRHMKDHKYLNSTTQIDGKGGFFCVLCEKTYAKIKNYKAHIGRHAKYFVLKKLTGDEQCSLSFIKVLFSKSHLREKVKICACLSYGFENYTAEKLYCCGICEESFAKMDFLKEHIMLHGASLNASNAKLYSCKLCLLFFSKLDDLQEHVTLRTDFLKYGLLMKTSKEDQNRKDQNITKVKSNFKWQVKSERKIQYFCDFCGISYTSIVDLKNHIKDHNKYINTETKSAGERWYSCALCEKPFTTVSSYKRHIQKHAQYFILKDHIVDENNPLLLKMFEKSHVKDEVKICSCLVYDSVNYVAEKIYGCAICEKSFAEMSYLKEHLELHGIFYNDVNVNKYSCALCWAFFSNMDDLEEHLILRSYVLSYRLLTKDEKGQDFIVDRGKSQFSCGLCDNSYSNVSELRTHIRVHSTKPKQYSCGLCEKSFEEVGGLKAHIPIHTKSGSNEEQHTSQLNNTLVQVNESKQQPQIYGKYTGGCSYYKKDFSERSNLNQHQVLNKLKLKKRIYTCNYFEVLQSIKASNGENELKWHRSCDISMHFNEEFHKSLPLKCTKKRPYLSGYCKRSFKSLNLLKCHLRIHTGEKPYSCDYCEKVFTYKKQFLLHLETHTKTFTN